MRFFPLLPFPMVHTGFPSSGLCSGASSDPFFAPVRRALPRACHPQRREGSASLRSLSSSAFSAPSALRTPFELTTAVFCKCPQQYQSMGLAFPLFSYSYALFCHWQNAKPFIFSRFRTLWQNTRGGRTFFNLNHCKLAFPSWMRVGGRHEA
jgi:hypothetical protein